MTKLLVRILASLLVNTATLVMAGVNEEVNFDEDFLVCNLDTIVVLESRIPLIAYGTACWGITAALAQGGAIEGKVMNAETGEGLQYTHVTLKEGGRIISEVTADVCGNYRIGFEEFGHFEIWADHKGGFRLKESIIPDRLITKLDLNLRNFQGWSCPVRREVVEFSHYCKLIQEGDSSPADTPSDFDSRNRWEASNFHYYPNPTTGTLKIEFDQPPNDLFLVDMSGKRLKRFMIRERDRLEISLHDIPSGIYVLRSSGKTRSYTGKLVVMH